jgi:hypothetical protein
MPQERTNGWKAERNPGKRQAMGLLESTAMAFRLPLLSLLRKKGLEVDGFNFRSSTI